MQPSETLTEEHPLPHGLGGIKTIPNASCENCREITARFENTALRHTVGPGRYWLGIKSRNAKNRPKSWPAFGSDSDGQRRRIEIPLADLPFFMALPTFPTHAIVLPLISNDHDPVTENGVIMVQEDEAIIRKHLEKYGAEKFRFQIDHLAFARMLAKIAHGYCVYEFGFGNFTSFVSPLILGQTNGYTSFISSSVTKEMHDVGGLPLERRYEHDVQHMLSSDGHAQVCVKIEMFRNLGAPTYYVLAGLTGNPPPLVQWSANAS